MSKKQMMDKMMELVNCNNNWDFIISAYRAAVEDNQTMMYSYKLMMETLAEEYGIQETELKEKMMELHQKKKQEHELYTNPGVADEK